MPFAVNWRFRPEPEVVGRSSFKIVGETVMILTN